MGIDFEDTVLNMPYIYLDNFRLIYKQIFSLSLVDFVLRFCIVLCFVLLIEFNYYKNYLVYHSFKKKLLLIQTTIASQFLIFVTPLV